MIFDVTDPELKIDGLSSFVINGLLNAQKEKAYLTTTGYNRMQSYRCETLIPNYESEKAWWDEVGAQVSEIKVDIDSVSVGYTRVPHDSTDFLLIPTVSFIGNLEVLGIIPGVHESTMNLLMGSENGYRISLAWDLRDGSLVQQ